jgi:hypothetical protein
MILAGAFAVLLFLILVVGDWLYFVQLSPDAGRYGCTIARAQERVAEVTLEQVQGRFDPNGVIVLPHGMARYFPDVRRIVIRPKYRLFYTGFRTAGPLNGAIVWPPEATGFRVMYFKRIPWSSAIIPMIWFLLVGLGTIGFVESFLVQGGLASLGGVLLGVGVIALGLLVLAFGLLTITFAYRLEDSRLTLVYQELRGALAWSKTPA